MPRKTPYVIELSLAEKRQLERRAGSYTSPYYLVIRARIILLAAQGKTSDRIARRLFIPRQIVSKWRKRFFEDRLAGLEDQRRSGRPRKAAAEPGVPSAEAAVTAQNGDFPPKRKQNHRVSA